MGRLPNDHPFKTIIRKYGISEKELSYAWGYKSPLGYYRSSKKAKLRDFTTWLINRVESTIIAKIQVSPVSEVVGMDQAKGQTKRAA